jgi:hypothetical protein
MAVGIRISLPGVGVEEFDRIDAGVNVRGEHPDGLIFSCSGPVDGGWRVLDVWESRAQFDTFIAERVWACCWSGWEHGSARGRGVPYSRVRLALARRDSPTSGQVPVSGVRPRRFSATYP